MYLSTENNDSSASIHRIYKFSERDEARGVKARFALEMLEQLVEAEGVSKVSATGLILAPTCRLYYKELILTVKRPKQETVIIGIGAKHYRRPERTGVHSLARVRVHSADSILPLDVNKDPLIRLIREYLNSQENQILYI